jgi:predicted transcriptional regulator
MENPKEIKTVERTVTVKVPETFDNELQILAKALKRTVESILKEELYGTMENWYSGGFAEGWVNMCSKSYEESKEIEKEVTKIADAEDY